MKKSIFSAALIVLVSQASFGGTLTVKIMSIIRSEATVNGVELGTLKSSNGNLVITSSQGTCEIDSEFAKKNGYDLIGLASALANNQADIVCEYKRDMVALNSVQISFKVK